MDTTYYAEVKNNIVVQIIVAELDFINTLPNKEDWHEYFYEPCPAGKNACIGYTYDLTNDVFYAQQPYPSWVLNKTTWKWEAPTPYPENGKFYQWDENTDSWQLIPDAI